MFDIEYGGGNNIIITTKKAKLIVDANRSIFGLKNVVEKDAIELATEKRFLTNAPDFRVSIEGPGEYEVSDLAIKGIAAYRNLDDPKTSPMDSNIYSIAIDNTRIGIIGNVSDSLTDTQLEELGIIDILVIPVGGSGYTLDATAAATITRRIDPKIVIPVHYAETSLNYEVPQDKAEVFLGELKATIVEDKKLKIKSELSLPETLTAYKLTLER